MKTRVKQGNKQTEIERWVAKQFERWVAIIVKYFERPVASIFF